MSIDDDQFVRAASLAEVEDAGCIAIHVNGHTLALVAHDGDVYAVDNRCPHMGFPLHQGSVQDGILTCHWHHARFDLESGGTFDLWADDVRSFPTEIRDGEVWVDVTPQRDEREHQRERLHDGLERNISLVIAKAVIKLLKYGEPAAESFRVGLDYGTRYRRPGWGQGLTIHTCMMNLLPYLDNADKSRALYQGAAAVASDTDEWPPRFMVDPLPGQTPDIDTLTRWFRKFVEVRDAEGAERCITSAVRAGADDRQLADMLFAAATDHRYIDTGHRIDFTNKAFEALDTAGWEDAEQVEQTLTSLAHGFAMADRMEESNSWRNPIDLVAILEEAFDEIGGALDAGSAQRGTWTGSGDLVPVLLDDDPHAIASALLDAIRAGTTEVELARTVSYAAALRIAQFPTSNEFSDWDTALHTFTFANAVHQGLKRSPSEELLRGVFDAAMSVYLDRFLNMPAVSLPAPQDTVDDPAPLLNTLPDLLDERQQVNDAGTLVARYINSGGDPDRLLAALGRLLLREDRDFHTIQTIEAAFRLYEEFRGDPRGAHVLVAAARYLAAHAPTMRSQGQTYEIALRLSRGENIYEG